MQTQTNWLVFREGKHPFAPLAKKGFGHVSILMKDEFNWLQLDSLADSLCWKILPYSAKEDVPRKYRKAGREVLKVETISKVNKNYDRFGIIGIGFICVRIAKYVCGIRLRCVTPFGLYKRLVKMARTQKYSHDVTSVQIMT